MPLNAIVCSIPKLDSFHTLRAVALASVRAPCCLVTVNTHVQYAALTAHGRGRQLVADQNQVQTTCLQTPADHQLLA